MSYDMLYDANLESVVRNNWIRPVSTSGNLSQFELINLDTGEEYDKINDIFQLGTILKGDTINLRLSAISSSCIKENISIEHGWNCEPYILQDQMVCFRDTLECLGISPPGVIDFLPDTTGISALLCDTFPRINIEIFNAGLGSLAEILFEMQLPPGLSIVPNSSVIEYPTTSLNRIPIDDPDSISNKILMWNIASYFSGAQGSLPGINAFPQNSFTLSFQVKSDCEFISGSRIIYSSGGTLLCNEESNTVAKLSGPLSIIDVDPSYQTYIEMDSEINACNDELDISLSIRSDLNTMLMDEIVIQLPQGLFYVPGSCISTMWQCEPVIDGDLLSWNLPPDEMNLEYQLKLGGMDSLECGSLIIAAYSTSKTNVLCAEDSTDCSIKIATGESIEQVFLDRPIFDIESISVNDYNFQEKETDLTISLSNGSTINEDSIIISLYRDNDNSGNLSNDDIFLGDYLFDNRISEGQTADLNLILLDFDIEEMCDLLFVIDENKNCVCRRTELLWNGEIILKEFEHFSVCSGESLVIGIDEETGDQYRWTSPIGLSCTDCSRTQLSPVNAGVELMSYVLTLEQTTESLCKIIYEFVIDVHFEPGIWSRDHELCPGEELTLLASDAISYMWEGHGIIDPHAQSQIFIPDSSGLYIVSITDVFNCSAVDSVYVTVLEAPEAEAGEDQLVCYGKDVFLKAENFNENYMYSWLPGFPFIEMPNAHETVVIIAQDQEYILTVFDGHCFNSDTSFIRFYDGLDIDVPESITVCHGDPVMISLEDSLTYTWEPFFSNMCLNASCSQAIFYPESSLTMMLLGESDDQCRDTVLIDIIVLDNDSINSIQLGICPGDSVEWSGIYYTEAGTYCDTLFSPEGCTYLSCLELMIYSISDLEIESDNTTVFPGTSIQLTSTLGFETYSWEQNSSLNCLDCSDPIATIETDEIFILTATDIHGCIQMDSIEIRATIPCTLDDVLIPNAFTPNDNLKNEKFRIANKNTDTWNIHIEIYDRWGELIYEGLNNDGWDGTYKGEDASEGVYLYIIRVDCGNGKEKLFNGNVSLIK